VFVPADLPAGQHDRDGAPAQARSVHQNGENHASLRQALSVGFFCGSGNSQIEDRRWKSQPGAYSILNFRSSILVGVKESPREWNPSDAGARRVRVVRRNENRNMIGPPGPNPRLASLER
jgi:hypothetical protein